MWKHSLEVFPTSVVEVPEVLKKLLGGRAPWVNETHLEFLMALDFVGLACLTTVRHCMDNASASLSSEVKTGCSALSR